MDGILAWLGKWLSDWQIQADPIAALIALLALVVAILALRESRRGTKLANEIAEERGRFRRVELLNPDLDKEELQQGKPIGTSAIHAKADMSTGAMEAVAFSGADSLTIDRVHLTVTYSEGWITRVFYSLTVPVNGDRINWTGPSLPYHLDPYHNVRWRLPKVLIQPLGMRNWCLPTIPGTIVLGARAAIRFRATVGSTSWRSDGSAERTYGLPWVLRPANRFLDRRYPYSSLADLLTDPAVPQVLKVLLELWLISPDPPSGDVKDASPSRQQASNTGRNRKNRVKRKTR
jgi:hypothetical protein